MKTSCAIANLRYLIISAILIPLYVVASVPECVKFYDPSKIVEKNHTVSDFFVPSIADISPLEIKNFQNYTYGSHGKYGTATYRGVKVFLKAKDNQSIENMWLHVLNGVGLGVKLFGTVMLGESRFIVTEMVEGENSKFQPKPNGPILTLTMVEEMKRQIRAILEVGAYPADLQFVLTRDQRVVIIDTDYELLKNILPGWNNDRKAIENFLVSEFVEGAIENWKSAGLYRE